MRYKGFHIHARPYQIHRDRTWTVDLEIQRGGRRKFFSLDERYPTEREAEVRCVALGRAIIDGKIGGWSVGSLRPEGFLTGLRDGTAHRFAGTGSILVNLGILAIIALGAFVLLRGAFVTP